MCINDKQKADCNTQKIHNHLCLHYSQQVKKPQGRNAQRFTAVSANLPVRYCILHLHCNCAYCKSIYKQHLFTFNTFSFLVFLLSESLEGETDSSNSWATCRITSQSGTHWEIVCKVLVQVWKHALQGKQVLEKPKEHMRQNKSDRAASGFLAFTFDSFLFK